MFGSNEWRKVGRARARGEQEDEERRRRRKKITQE